MFDEEYHTDPGGDYPIEARESQHWQLRHPDPSVDARQHDVHTIMNGIIRVCRDCGIRGLS